jgi:hypothetical protein
VPAFQVGRRGFESRLPLHFIFDSFCSVTISFSGLIIFYSHRSDYLGLFYSLHLYFRISLWPISFLHWFVPCNLFRFLPLLLRRMRNSGSRFAAENRQVRPEVSELETALKDPGLISQVFQRKVKNEEWVSQSRLFYAIVHY